MEKVLIEIDGTIHTFESIKEAAKHKLEFCERMESLLGDNSNERFYIDNLIKYQLSNDPNDFYEKHMKGNAVEDIEELLIDLCTVGIDIDEYFVCAKQDKKKRGFCGVANYKNLCEMLEEDEDDFSDENDINEDMLDELLFSDSLYFCSSTKKGCNKKNIAKRRKKNKNKKTHRK
jgi:hypothetical protein